MTKFICSSIEDTKAAAVYFSQFAKSGQCFALYGDLGYGKTTFSKYLIAAINPVAGHVTSPTFSLIQIYEYPYQPDLEIWHIDCYRFKYQEEFYELGLEEACRRHITIIEWPEIIQGLLPKNVIKIKFSMDLMGEKRHICAI